MIVRNCLTMWFAVISRSAKIRIIFGLEIQMMENCCCNNMIDQTVFPSVGCRPEGLTLERERELHRLLLFLEEYTAALFGSGVHSSRVIRNARRVARSQGAELTLYSSLRAEILSLRDLETGHVMTRVVPVPDLPINFELNSDLSALSWDAVDEELTLDEIERRYRLMRRKENIHPLMVLLLISLANGAFCHLFGGDAAAVFIVVIATGIGFQLKRILLSKGLNIYLTVVGCSFVASLLASGAILVGATPQVAVATSPLFLVPGVPLINGVIDIVEGHVVTGMSRLVKALLMIFCIALGLAGTLLLTLHGIYSG